MHTDDNARRNSKMSLSLFPRAQWHKIYNLVTSKDLVEQNIRSSLEIKRRIVRIEVSYSLALNQSCLCLLERQCQQWHLSQTKMRAFVRWKNKLFVWDTCSLLEETLRSLFVNISGIFSFSRRTLWMLFVNAYWWQRAAEMAKCCLAFS